MKYSIEVDEGNYSASQRQMELQQLLNFKEMGMPIPNKSILRASFISNKKLVIQEMEQEQQQQAQVQQAQMQQQNQVDQSKIMATMAKAQLDTAKVQETFAKIDDLEATAEHKGIQSDLDLVKMMVELEDMQFNQFKNAFEYAQAVKLANSESVKKQTTPVG